MPQDIAKKGEAARDRRDGERTVSPYLQRRLRNLDEIKLREDARQEDVRPPRDRDQD